MTDIFSALSSQLAMAADTAAAAVVQLQGHRRLVAGVVVDADLVVTPGIGVHDGVVSVRRGDGQTFDGIALGRRAATGPTVLRVAGLGAPTPATADQQRLTAAAGRAGWRVVDRRDGADAVLSEAATRPQAAARPGPRSSARRSRRGAAARGPDAARA